MSLNLFRLSLQQLEDVGIPSTVNKVKLVNQISRYPVAAAAAAGAGGAAGGSAAAAAAAAADSNFSHQTISALLVMRLKRRPRVVETGHVRVV